ncbi:MAG: tandem-95 repeat protein, partial [Myxococcales bacterium]|nr:tandem-95 repeat protein [Myxococcales bacterium]
MALAGSLGTACSDPIDPDYTGAIDLRSDEASDESGGLDLRSDERSADIAVEDLEGETDLLGDAPEIDGGFDTDGLENTPPIASDSEVSGPEDEAVELTLTAEDEDGDTLTFRLVTLPEHGTLEDLDLELGTALYVPDADYAGTDVIGFVANDGSDDSNLASVAIRLTPVNDAPVVTSRTVNVLEDTPTVIALELSDVDGDQLSLEIDTAPEHGSAETTGNAVFYTPDEDYFGDDSIVVSVTDGELTATGTISITVTPLTDIPVAFDQSEQLDEDTVLESQVTAAVADEELSYEVQTFPRHGDLEIDPDTGEFTYTPNPNYNGTDSFTFVANTDKSSSSPAVVLIQVLPVNDRPVAQPRSIQVNEDSATTFLLLATDPDGDTLPFQIQSQPLNGDIVLNGSQATYTPDSNFSGEDRFTFVVDDGLETSAAAEVTLTIQAQDDPPEAIEIEEETNEDVPVNISLEALDPDGDELTFQLGVAPSHGEVSLEGNEATYTPDADYFGSDWFVYEASDEANSSFAVVQITIHPINDAPFAESIALSTNEDVGRSFTLSCVDVEDDPLTYSVTHDLRDGELDLDEESGDVNYVPDLNFNGSDSFRFRCSDGELNSNEGSVLIQVAAVNDPAVAIATSVVTDEDTPITIDLDAEDPDDDPVFSLQSQPQHGSLDNFDAENGSVRYTPDANFVGTDQFAFSASDGHGQSLALVTISVGQVADRPVAFAQQLTIDEDKTVSIVLEGEDPDDDTLTFTITANPVRGQISGFDPSTGELTYTPDSNVFGSDRFSFNVSDGALASTDAFIDITIRPINDLPQASEVTVTTAEDEPVNIQLIAEDPDSDITFALVTQPQHGSLSGFDAATGTVRYTPALDYTGSDQFVFSASDGGAPSVALVRITVLEENDPPIAMAQTVTTPEDVAVLIQLQGQDADDLNLTYAISLAPISGSLDQFDAQSGTVRFTPGSEFSGEDRFRFTVSDGNTTSPEAIVTVNVTAVNDPPVAHDQTINLDEDQPASITLTATDPDNSVTFRIISAGQHGVITGFNASTGTFTYTPASQFNGQDTILFGASDGQVEDFGEITLLIAAVNDPPVANALAVTTLE